MTEQQHPEPGEDKQADGENTEESGTERQDRRKGGSRGKRVLALLLLILIIVALAGVLGAAWLWFMGSPQTHRLQRRVEQLEQQVERNSSRVQQRGSALRRLDRIAGRQQELARHMQHLANNQSALNQTMSSVQETLNQLNDLIRGGRLLWRLNAVEELLLMANDRLALRGDVSGALQAFRIAQRRLGRIADPRLIPVRKHLADMIAALESIPRLDVTGMALRLSSLTSRVDELPLAPHVPKNYHARQPEEESTAEHWWVRLGDAVTDTLKGLVRIRRTDQPPQALLPPDQAFFLYQNLKLKLEAARLALLRGQNRIFHDSLGRAIDWLHAYFNLDATGVQAMLADLERMQGRDLQPELPATGKALAALRKTMRQMGGGQGMQLQPAGTGNPGGVRGT